MDTKLLSFGSVVIVLAVVGRGPIHAQTLSVDLQHVASGLVSPLMLTHAGDGSGRLFVVDQVGLLRVIDGSGQLLATPFLDLTAKIVTLNSVYDERGFLGVAFHPDYANNGRLFVRYSTPRAGDPLESCNDPGGFVVGCHTEVLAEYSVSAGDPNQADPISENVLFTIDEPEFNHNAGGLAFGPDGYLYFSLGDGGGANDGLHLPELPHGAIGNGQNIETPLGAMLRIDVDSAPQTPLSYAIPPDNPFVGATGLDEIFAFGMRNPYRFSFDDGVGGDGSLYLGDVGQDLYEEVDIVVSGGNYGWVIKEGTHCFDPLNPGMPPATCADAGMIDPVDEYSHAKGGLSVIGGFVYRGSAVPELTGTYVYGDFSAEFFAPLGRLYYFETTGPEAFQRKEFLLSPAFDRFLKGFGEDESGELYVLASTTLGPTGSGGSVHRIERARLVPTTSEWGLVILTLCLFAAGTVRVKQVKRCPVVNV